MTRASKNTKKISFRNLLSKHSLVLFIVAVIILLIGSGTAVFGIAQLNAETDSNTALSLQNDDLNNQLQDAQSQISDLQSQVDSLEQQNNDLLIHSSDNSEVTIPSIQSVCGSPPALSLSTTDPGTFKTKNDAWEACVSNYGKGKY